MNDSTFLSIQTSKDNVVHLEHTKLEQGVETFPACADLHRYWQDLRGTRQMPARSEFDPRGIETSLSTTFVAEKVAPSVARIRVSGSVLNDALGMDVRGMPITALFDPTARDSVSEAIRDLFASPAMVVLELNARHGFNRKPLRARMLLLPMSDADGNIARIVGCLDIEGGLGKTPRRFRVSSMRRTDVTGTPPVVVKSPPLYEPVMQSRTSDKTYAFAEDAPVFRSKRQQELEAASQLRPRSGLRLVVNND